MHGLAVQGSNKTCMLWISNFASFNLKEFKVTLYKNSVYKNTVLMRGKDEKAYFWMATRIRETITGLKLGRLELCPSSFVDKLSDFGQII